MFKYFRCLFGLILSLPILVLTALAFVLPISISGVGYLFGSLLVVLGLVIAPWNSRYSAISAFIGAAIVGLIVISRIVVGSSGTDSQLRMVTLPEGKAARWISYIVDEQDSLILGETAFHWIGGDSSREHEGLTTALLKDYSEMRSAQGIVPSPVISTYMAQQLPGRFDALVIAPKDHPKFGVIFLHGYMGNVAGQCWVISQVVKSLDGLTICPATEWRGEWWQPQGQSILQSTFDYMRSQGITRIYLGGFSNGGFSMGRLASELGNEKGLNGLFFIDGFENASGVRSLGLPILIIQGGQDERVPVDAGRQFAFEVGNLGSYVELDSDHFLIMKQPEQVQHAIGGWLETQEESK